MSELDVNTILKGTIGLTKAALGIRVADEQDVTERRNICRACCYRKIVHHKILGGDVAKCTVCKCYIKPKTLLKDEKCDDAPPRWNKL